MAGELLGVGRDLVRQIGMRRQAFVGFAVSLVENQFGRRAPPRSRADGTPVSVSVFSTSWSTFAVSAGVSGWARGDRKKRGERGDELVHELPQCCGCSAGRSQAVVDRSVEFGKPESAVAPVHRHKPRTTAGPSTIWGR